jgi:hypothetical protein
MVSSEVRLTGLGQVVIATESKSVCLANSWFETYWPYFCGVRVIGGLTDIAINVNVNDVLIRPGYGAFSFRWLAT